MSRRSTVKDVDSRSLLPSRPLPSVPLESPGNGIGKCLLLSIVFGVIVIALTLLMRSQLIASDKKRAMEMAGLRKDFGAKLDTALTKQAEQAGLIQSFGQTLNAEVANGSLTQSQLTAIAAGIQASQAAKGAVKAQTGTTPGIPGSRSGGGMSVTPGVVGSGGPRGNTVAASPGTSRSSTSDCLLTIESGILRIDGTVCPP